MEKNSLLSYVGTGLIGFGLISGINQLKLPPLERELQVIPEIISITSNHEGGNEIALAKYAVETIDYAKTGSYDTTTQNRLQYMGREAANVLRTLESEDRKLSQDEYIKGMSKVLNEQYYKIRSERRDDTFCALSFVLAIAGGSVVVANRKRLI